MNWTIIHLLERMNFSDNENKNYDFNEFIDTKNIKRVYSVLGGFSWQKCTTEVIFETSCKDNVS